jgi:hypothetical protein
VIGRGKRILEVLVPDRFGNRFEPDLDLTISIVVEKCVCVCVTLLQGKSRNMYDSTRNAAILSD